MHQWFIRFSEFVEFSESSATFREKPIMFEKPWTEKSLKVLKIIHLLSKYNRDLDSFNGESENQTQVGILINQYKLYG